MTPPYGLNHQYRGNTFHKIGKRLHEYHNHAFNLSQLYMEVEKIFFLILYTTTLAPPLVWTPYPRVMNITSLVECFMDIITMNFFPKCVGVLKKFLNSWSYLTYLALSMRSQDRTVPETFNFPIFPGVHLVFTVCLPCVHLRSLLRCLSSTQKALNMRLTFIQRLLIVELHNITFSLITIPTCS